MRRPLPKSLRDGSGLSPAVVPAWAVERLAALPDCRAVRALGEAVDALASRRLAGTPDEPWEKVELRDRIRETWHETVLRPMSAEPDPQSAALRAAIAGLFATARATDAMAFCLPWRDRIDEGTRARMHLERAIAFLEPAMAIEAAVARPAMSRTRVALHDAQDERGKQAERALRDVWAEVRSKAGAVAGSLDETLPLARPPGARTLPGLRPVAVAQAEPTVGPGAFRVPALRDVWLVHLMPTLRGLLEGGHRLALEDASVTVAGGRARYAVTLGSGQVLVAVEAAYASGVPEPEMSMRLLGPGPARPLAREDAHRVLHEMAGDPASVRIVAQVLREDPDRERFAIGATGPYGVRVSPNWEERDPERFGAALRRVEALAEESGVKVEVGVDGLAVRVSDLLANGYEWAGKDGETVMVRKPPVTNVLAFA